MLQFQLETPCFIHSLKSINNIGIPWLGLKNLYLCAFLLYIFKFYLRQRQSLYAVYARLRVFHNGKENSLPIVS